MFYIVYLHALQCREISDTDEEEATEMEDPDDIVFDGEPLSDDDDNEVDNFL